MDVASYVALLRRYALARALQQGMNIHHHIVCSNLEQELIVANYIVHMYGRCGSIHSAISVFDHMHTKNVFSWTILIKVLSEDDIFSDEASLRFHQMTQEGTIPNQVSFLSVVSACIRLDMAKRMHVFIINCAFDDEIVVDSALVSTYSKCGSLMDSRKMFEKMKVRNEVSWNAIISAYASVKQWKDVLTLYKDMYSRGLLPTKVTYLTVLGAFGDPLTHVISECKWMHTCISSIGMDSDVMVGTALVNVYSKLGFLQEALMAFKMIFEPNTISWNTIIGSYIRFDFTEDALGVLYRMQLEGIFPDKFTFILLLPICDCQKTLLMHGFISSCKFESDITIENALISTYGKCGRLRDAWVIFDAMSSRNVVTWNALLGALLQHEQVEVVIQIFQQMLLQGIEPDQVSFSIAVSACASMLALVIGTWLHVIILARRFLLDHFLITSLLSMYGKNGDLENAQKIHDASDKYNVVGWTAMISTCGQKGLCKEAFQLYKQMLLQSIVPTKATIINMLDVCAIQPLLVEGKRVHACLLSEEILSHVAVENALMNMYIKCGHLIEASIVFQSMQERDIVTWTTMITGQTQLGHGIEIHHLCKRMCSEGIVLNEVTFISILEACSHVGLIDEAYYYFAMMPKEHGIAPDIEHYNCMVDLLSRAGHLLEAEFFIHKMPFYSTMLPWLTLLSACRFHMDVEAGKKAANNLRILEPDSKVADALLANIHVILGQWKEVSNLRRIVRSMSDHTAME